MTEYEIYSKELLKLSPTMRFVYGKTDAETLSHIENSLSEDYLKKLRVLNYKFKNTKNKVWCWLGDMSAETGAFHEAYKYARNNKLPINYVIECNNKSVMTPTDETWNRTIPYFIDDVKKFDSIMKEKKIYKQDNLWYYEYNNTKYPHAGAGERVQF